MYLNLGGLRESYARNLSADCELLISLQKRYLALFYTLNDIFVPPKTIGINHNSPCYESLR